jgi:hypothetical protein
MGGYILAYDEQFTKFIFCLSLKQKLLYAYTENTLNGEISNESVYISVNNNTNFKKIEVLSIYTIWDKLSLKTISRYCPFKGSRYRERRGSGRWSRTAERDRGLFVF